MTDNITMTETRAPIDQIDLGLDLLRTLATALLSDFVDAREATSYANTLDMAIRVLEPVREQINAANAL